MPHLPYLLYSTIRELQFALLLLGEVPDTPHVVAQTDLRLSRTLLTLALPRWLYRMMDSSTTLASSYIMNKFFGVTHEQALRVQALLRLGISEDDVRVAERLMAPRSATDRGAKVEWLLGCTVEQMSYKKALEVLGISEAVMEEERAKMLGGLGVRAWANPPASTGTVDRNQNAGSCGGLFGKRSHGHSLQPGSARVFDMAPSPTEDDVTGLEDICFEQHLIIQQLEQQVAALTEASAPPAPSAADEGTG